MIALLSFSHRSETTSQIPGMRVGNLVAQSRRNLPARRRGGYEGDGERVETPEQMWR